MCLSAPKVKAQNPAAPPPPPEKTVEEMDMSEEQRRRMLNTRLGTNKLKISLNNNRGKPNV